MIKFAKFKKDEKGATIIEWILLMATIGILVSFLGPWFKAFMGGTTDPDAPRDSGFVNRVMENQTQGLSESYDSVELIPGCDTSLVDTCP